MYASKDANGLLEIEEIIISRSNLSALDLLLPSSPLRACARSHRQDHR